MPQKGDRREEDGKKKVWHHELGWIDVEWSEWGANDDEVQAQLDVDSAEVKL
ncbi:hypothetical protein [Rhizobium lentis]|uniref:Uncharacterized protein n=1 Tax=Rhizobium lentis TaxID=1138194 RepID=A0A9Q3QU36_9HYPH|nr:hypothetical protein [Rhizobium lentis]MBX5021171.1 hypothetical protein [Rhizobium lentis]